MTAKMPKFTRKMIEPNFFRQHEIDWEKVDRYAARLLAGEIPPPTVVARYGEEVMPLDGHHRLAAAKKVGRKSDVWECDGEEFEDFCLEVGSAEGDRLILERYGITQT